MGGAVPLRPIRAFMPCTGTSLRHFVSPFGDFCLTREDKQPHVLCTAYKEHERKICEEHSE
jgi:hypothetical protein